MKIWVDEQLSPIIAQWFTSAYGIEAVAVRDLRLRDVLDRDMADLVPKLGTPPQIWTQEGA